ncbi:prolyl oligopeptidase family serine peptidase [Acrocarpospora macrocephala]|uniref:Peptide hydrolase n=1 Tax=Acrocarpospora macrocephala TaxID=150177 RepID=A0A5M3WYZ2_9ACTN|nr:prolyl oligopeptidase family serine peptidase [Acrocarpospora macrocephala]GES14184.1 peptide hydrolase [Acrocarpospora macrocephala]
MKAEERWQARFRAPRTTLPVWARQAPHHAVYRSNTSGTWEIYAWDRATGQTRQVTNRPNGTAHGDVDPTGQWIWWFADTDGDEYGVWIRQPFGGGPAEPVNVSPGYPCGLGLAANGTAAIGRACRKGFQVVLVHENEDPKLLYEHDEFASVAGISLDGSLIAINHSEHGDSRHPALRVLKSDGTVVGDLRDGSGKGVTGIRFAPVLGDRRLLVLHERRGRHEPLVWDPVTGEQREIYLRVPGEVTADWYVDGRSLLIVHNHRGRTELLKYDLAGGAMMPIDTPHGVIDAAVARPDGTVEYSWSSAAQAPVIRSSNGHVVINPGPTAPPSVPLEDIDVEGPGGRIHALVSRPIGTPQPYPTVFLLHGGPSAQDDDSFQPHVAAWVDSGFAVIRINYRGSAGYGSAWRDALHGDIGHIELADVAAVRDWVVNRGIADPERLLLSGSSWGGFLTLLGLGTQPKAWTAGIAAVPIADHTAAYEDEAEGLRAYHRALIGGSPAEFPDRYTASSPITYADMVEAPVLVLAGENDPRCPIRQIENYLDALSSEYNVYRYDATHASRVVEERIRQMRTQIDFANRVLARP